MPINMGLNYAGVCTNPLHFGILSDNELKEIAFKQYLKNEHAKSNYPFYEIFLRDSRPNDLDFDIDWWEIYRKCNGDKRPDDKCEFWKVSKELNLENLLSIGRQICKDGKQVAQIDKSILKAIDDESVVYPWEDSKLFNDKGELNYSVYYKRKYHDEKTHQESDLILKFFQYNSIAVFKSDKNFTASDKIRGESDRIVYIIKYSGTTGSLMAMLKNRNFDSFCEDIDSIETGKRDLNKLTYRGTTLLEDNTTKTWTSNNYGEIRIRVDNCGNGLETLYHGPWDYFEEYMKLNKIKFKE